MLCCGDSRSQFRLMTQHMQPSLMQHKETFCSQDVKNAVGDFNFTCESHCTPSCSLHKGQLCVEVSRWSATDLSSHPERLCQYEALRHSKEVKAESQSSDAAGLTVFRMQECRLSRSQYLTNLITCKVSICDSPQPFEFCGLHRGDLLQDPMSVTLHICTALIFLHCHILGSEAAHSKPLFFLNLGQDEGHLQERAERTSSLDDFNDC